MQTPSVTQEFLRGRAPADWWYLTARELERLAVGVLGSRPGGWVRTGKSFVIVARVKFGALAPTLGRELEALGVAAKAIRAGGTPESALCAAAFYHLRFENVHPLHEGNGRIGRIILAAQLHESLGRPLELTLQRLRASEAEYKAVFAAWTPQLSFHTLVKLLGRICDVPLPVKDYELPASLEPLHPTPGSPLKGPPQVAPGPTRRTPTQSQRPFWQKRR